MNIFTALSQGKGRLDEENMSAMLGYLLSPTQTHGFGDVFLRRFLMCIEELSGIPNKFGDILSSTIPINAEVILEQKYSLGNYTRSVDIEIQIFKSNTEIYRIDIENKVKPGAAEKIQFREEFEAVLSEIEGEDKLEVVMVFISPAGDHNQLNEEYEELKQEILGDKHCKTWIRWTQDDDKNTVTSLLKGILRSESKCEINPVSEYVRHTLKAFIRHILEGHKPLKFPPELGEIVEVVIVELGITQYRIEKYKSSAIKVFNINSQEYESAKLILKKINEDRKLGIQLPKDRQHTRYWGNAVIKELKSQNKDVKEVPSTF